MGSGTTGTTKEPQPDSTCTSETCKTDIKVTAEIEATRISRRATPGAFHVSPTYTTNNSVDGNPSEGSGNDTDGTGDCEQGQQVGSNGPSSLATGATAPELTEAWLVKNGASSSSSNTAEESGFVAVTATPIKERRWFMTSSIFWILLVGGIIAIVLAILLSKRQKDTGPTRPFDIVLPTMPQEVSQVLELKYSKLRSGNPIAMAFSADLTIHASTLVDAFYGKLQICKYHANTNSWEIVSEFDEEEARKNDFMDRQTGISAGDGFGTWADMSYDGNILAVGLPKDDPMDIIDAGSVLVLKLSPEDGAENNENLEQLKLEGHGNYIMGEDVYGWTGSTFSLTADGSMIAVTSPIASNAKGNIRVYKFEQDESIVNGGVWIQIGQDIIGDEWGEGLAMVKLSEDGTTLAAGSYMYGQDNGKIKFFQWDANTNLWVQKGSAIKGDDKDRLGVFPQFSRDGHIVAFSQTGEPSKCHVYRWEETAQDWIRMDNGLSDSYLCMDLSPDGKKLILCSVDLQQCILQKFVGEEWVEVESFLESDGFIPYSFERVGNGEQIAGLAAQGNAYTIGFYNINS